MKIQAVDAIAPAAVYGQALPREEAKEASKDTNNQAPVEEKSGQQVSENPESPSKKQVEKALQQINKTMETYHTEIRFFLHEDSVEYMVKVIKSEDDTVIREIPPKKILDIVAHVKEMLGIIVDKFI